MMQIQINSELCSAVKDFPTDIKLGDLCHKIYQITGIEPNEMKLHLNNGIKDVETIDRPLATSDCLILDGTFDTIIVEDTNSESITNQLKNKTTDDVEFKLSEDDYKRRSDTALQWKRENKYGRFNPEYVGRLKKERALRDAKIETLKLNERCSVKTPDQPERRGWLRFIGKIPDINKEDIWCGIEFDEPLGKNNGSFSGKVYFGPTKDNYGGFIKPIHVESGKQYTPFSDFEQSDDEI
ncbi:Alf1p NDAI_0B04435 [Naumovozyma dairenensis CBS 421]|uniref:CAP-Gly domain-containing protein n=1 Tax=Naumovozyma dairenensis (strain ATCC 10597 / BCRC 20456 / CBS 421 / NBRC 0211 / NRRL Y-12639) TaxID=1071378 RepID=G0W6R7_NAUDC|nr:hypothetical protein NDAI_0B04435 [Naumovozyma dairenensis CBS 421]CCD23478.1 hypothetical protein NDAI_0B04435 [Naumovozyma dairenensis CBS 421]